MTNLNLTMTEKAKHEAFIQMLEERNKPLSPHWECDYHKEVDGEAMLDSMRAAAAEQVDADVAFYMQVYIHTFETLHTLNGHRARYAQLERWYWQEQMKEFESEYDYEPRNEVEAYIIDETRCGLEQHLKAIYAIEAILDEYGICAD